MTTQLPENVGYGQIVGRFILAVADGPDSDRFPDGTPAQGRITFTPTPTHLLNITAKPVPVTIIPKPIECTLDEEGYLIDSEGARGVWLIATDDEKNNPVGWPYRVRISLDGYSHSFNLNVPENEIVDLAKKSTVAGTPGSGIVRGPDGEGVPTGGVPGAVLMKLGQENFDSEWSTAVTSGTKSYVDSAVVDTLAENSTVADAAASAVDDALVDIDVLTAPVAGETFTQLTAPRPPVPLNTGLIVGMQPPHGFSPDRTKTFGTDSTDFILGRQSLKFSTKEDDTPAAAEREDLPLDLRGKNLRIALKVENIQAITELILYVADDDFTNYYLWEIMHASPPTNTAQQYFKEGEWAWLTLPWNSVSVVGEPSRQTVSRVRLRTRSRTGESLTVRWNGLAVIEQDTDTFPNGAVSFTYDDSLTTQYTEARPALDKYGWVGTAYTICDAVGSGGVHMTMTQLRALHEAGWEVAAHANTLQDHSDNFANMSEESLHNSFREMRQWLTRYGFTGGDHMAYPQGAYTPKVLEIAARYFVSARTINSRMGESIPPSDSTRIPSVSVSNMSPVSTVTKAIDKAVANKGWLVLTFHDLTPTAASGTQFRIVDHQEIVDYVKQVGAEVLPMGAALRRMG